MSVVESLLRDIDAGWRLSLPQPIFLHIIGASALSLQTNHVRGTRDSDILEIEMTSEIGDALLELAGPGTALDTKHRMYVELVPGGLPFLPPRPTWHDIMQLRHFHVRALDVVDVVVSKLFRFSADDVSDIHAVIESELVSHEQLIVRFKEAFDHFLYGARVQQLPGCVENLHTVERDLYDALPTPFEIPDWADR